MPISSLVFAVLVWTGVAIVLGVFIYVIYAVLRDAGWFGGRMTPKG